MKIVLSCEHASAAVPEQYQNLFAENDQTILMSHRGWDPGALRLSRNLESAFQAPLVRGEWSRLLLDLNRSVDNPERWSEYSRTLPDLQRKELEKMVFKPYWETLFETIKHGIDEAGCVLHLSIHSFVRVLNKLEREVDLGILFDPERSKETDFADALHSELQENFQGRLRIFKNSPYAGTDDGLTKILRNHFSNDHYLGIEIEVCSDLLEDRQSIDNVGANLSTAISSLNP